LKVKSLKSESTHDVEYADRLGFVAFSLGLTMEIFKKVLVLIKEKPLLRPQTSTF